MFNSNSHDKIIENVTISFGFDTEISTSISEELNASHSLESSRISSSNSENEGDRTPTFNEHTDQDACDFDPDVDDFLAPNLDRPKSNSSLNLGKSSNYPK